VRLNVTDIVVMQEQVTPTRLVVSFGVPPSAPSALSLDFRSAGHRGDFEEAAKRVKNNLSPTSTTS